LRRCSLVALLACLLLAPVARADGDPASDYLLTQPVFLPPDVVIPQTDSKRLTDEVAAAKARGYEIRVAVIGTRYDMGSVGALYRQPREYAVFLGQELRFVYKGRLLVVMPNGYGVSQGGKRWPAAQAVADRLAATGNGGQALATGAAAAVRRLAAAAGVNVPPAVADGSRSSSTRLVTGVVAVLVLLGAGVSLRRARDGPARMLREARGRRRR
jgi:hypothetical protein